nr:MAG TPA: putative structural protein [Caudoviricetes sp.]
MSFRLGDKIYKEILYFYTEDLTTENPLYVLTQLNGASVEITAESTEVNDKNGNLVKKIWKSKAGSFSATNAFVNMNVISASSGSTPIFASSDNKVTMPRMLHVKAGTEVDITGYVAGSVKVSQYYGDGSIGKTYELDTTAGADKFSISAETKKLTLPTDPDVEMYFVKYLREVEKGALITNRADQFPSSVRAIMKATYYNPCKKNELKADYIEFPSFQVSPETTFPIDSDSATMDFKGDLEIDYCGGEKVLYNVYDADEVDAE